MYERSINRKIKEAYYSVILESKLNKDQILEAYLNTIYFGCGNGIQTAAQAYFSKDVDEQMCIRDRTVSTILLFSALMFPLKTGIPYSSKNPISVAWPKMCIRDRL